MYRQWLQHLSSPIDELKGKIRETQESITAEKRKSLSRRATGGGGGGGKNNRNNSNRNQSNPNAAAVAAAAASQRAIEVRESLLTVYRDELAAMETFVKVIAVFVIKNSAADAADDEVRDSDASLEEMLFTYLFLHFQSLVSLLQPYQHLLKGLAPKNSLQVKTPIRRNSSKRSSGRRNRNRRSNSQPRGTPEKLKMKEIIGALKGEPEKKGAEKEPGVIDVLAEKEKLLSLKYYGSHFADTLKVDAETAADAQKEDVAVIEKSAEQESATSIEPKVEEPVETIPMPVTGKSAADLVKPASSAEEVQSKDDDKHETEAETVIESQPADLSEATVPKSYAEAAGAEVHTAPTSTPKFVQLVDPLPSEGIVSVADDQSIEAAEETGESPIQASENSADDTAEQHHEDNNKSADVEVTKDKAAEITANGELQFEEKRDNNAAAKTDIPEPKIEDVSGAESKISESNGIISSPTESLPNGDTTTATATTDPPPSTITKSDSTILNENPSLALPVICSPILPRADFSPVSASAAGAAPLAETEEFTTKSADVDSPPPSPPSPSPSPPSTAAAAASSIEADAKEDIKVNNTEVVESAEKAKEKTTLLKPVEGAEKSTAAASDNQYGTFSEPKVEVKVVTDQQTETSKVVEEVPEPAAGKTDLEAQKPETPKPSATAAPVNPAPPASAAKNGSSKNNNGNSSSTKMGLKKRSSAKKEKKSKSGKRSAGNNNGSNAGRSKPKACCSVM